MKILSLFILMSLIVSGNCYALDYSKIAKEVAERTNNELEEEIKDVLNLDEIRWLLQSQKDFKSLEHMRYLQEEVRRKALLQRRLNTAEHIFGGILKLGIAYWGFSQKSRYGNVTGGLFALSGVVQLFSIRF